MARVGFCRQREGGRVDSSVSQAGGWSPADQDGGAVETTTSAAASSIY